MIGLEVPHAHIHLVPMQSEADMHFGRQKLTPSQEELVAAAEKIRAAFWSTIHETKRECPARELLLSQGILFIEWNSNGYERKILPRIS